ncbi:rho GTPase-activating protein 10 [Protopterus annectens]|uniref:rho GTPase-activating protein 10 n=1 Tax=Protopterus annectens TaxID=7888 RepID=UPI001CFA4C31|nr:rho GTPase-activating protein 10 [Protopterus annectens]
MGLHPLEFSDCYLDSPWFRERLRAHEQELDRTNKFIKELLKDGKALIAAEKNLSVAQRKFAHSLSDFTFEFIGDAETDDERCIDESLQEFAIFLKTLEEQRELMALNFGEILIKPLEKFRKEQLGAVKEEKKKYDKETEKYYSSLEKHLNLSAKKKETFLQEADVLIEQIRHHFHEVSLEYVCKMQEIQERKKFEFVEPLLAFFQGIFTSYHQGYDLTKDFNHYKTQLQINIQNTRNRFEGTRSEVLELMKKIRKSPEEHKKASPFAIEDYVYIQEKRPAPFGSSWVKHYCMYKKDGKKLTMVPFDQRSGGKIGEMDCLTLKSCVKKNTDAIDKRFCLEIEVADRPSTVITVQAFSEDARKLWMEALDGKEQESAPSRSSMRREGHAQLDNLGFTILRKCISAVENRGISEQGLYRVGGVSSKIQRLLNLLMDEKTCSEVNLENPDDWEIKTITSVLKQYLRSLPEPLMTHRLYREFIMPVKSGDPESRINNIHFLVHTLPEKNREMLDILIKHLVNVSNNAKKNLMTVANLGVVFGPTLMRPQEETVAAIMDLKFQNIVVEILIENYEKIFKTMPSETNPQPISPPHAPPRQSRRQKNKRPLAVYNLTLSLENDKTKEWKWEYRTEITRRNKQRVEHKLSKLLPSTKLLNSDKDNRTTERLDKKVYTAATLTFRAVNYQTHMTSSVVHFPVEVPSLQRLHAFLISSCFFSVHQVSSYIPQTCSANQASSTASWMNPQIPSTPTSPASPAFFSSATTTEDCKLTPSFKTKRARAVFPCKAEHNSELSFAIGAIFEDVHFSREPGWLEGTLDGKTGLIPENYVEFL